ncbi:phage major capsid protein [Pseudonocardia sp. WMMC193]|uniref:phage major capsid protein n=1 Tax=Pseudonocardia sp. WMMC193 TaxID=2911965 RepID=UPI001F0295B9|nr:phage major capsid protein [Pseudonocardia sp. WMMC193]MCF7550495.1 phage major capsid protein [Pseudonocardia sp. WMMC193]
MARPNRPVPTGDAAIRAMQNPNEIAAHAEAGTFTDLLDSYTVAAMDSVPKVRAAVDEKVNQRIFDMARAGELDTSTRHPIHHATASATKGGARSRTAPGAVFDGLAPTLGAVFAAHAPRVRTPENDQIVVGFREQVRNMSSAIPADGGFTIPEEYRSEIIKNSLESSIVRSRATVYPMGSSVLHLPRIDEVTHADGTVYGAMTAFWTEEGGQLQKTSPKFGRIRLDTKKLTLYSEAPNELIQDGPAFDSWILNTMAEACSNSEDDAFLTGSGVGMPLGVLSDGNNGAVTVAKESGQAAGSVNFTNVTKMFSRMLPGSHSRAVWLANIELFPALAAMTIAVKNVAGNENVGGGPAWITSAADGTPLTLFGRPIIWTEKAPAAGSAGDLSFLDLSHYFIGDRLSMQATASEHFKYDTDETAFRVISRLDGTPGFWSPLTPRRGTATLSPFVRLGARA